MPTITNTGSGYRYWVADENDPQAVRLERIGTGQWQCDRCMAVVSELPERTFEQRAVLHVQGHQS
jgi:hypothetical protein